MEIASLCFYLFAALTLVSAIAVISSKNPVHSVLFLIFCFFNAAGLFVLLGAEYVAMTLVIVYVGAVAVLFLFVVMMLNIELSVARAKFNRYLPLGFALIALIIVEFLLVFYTMSASSLTLAEGAKPMPDAAQVTNTMALGKLLYTDYVYAFQLCGIILLVAMISAIVLTLRDQKTSFKQNAGRQQARKRSDAVMLVNVKPGQGA